MRPPAHNTGPKKNKIILACVGATYSFNRSFKASATLGD